MKSNKLLVFLLFLTLGEIESQNLYEDIVKNTSASTLEQLSPRCQIEIQKYNFLTPTFWQMVDAGSKIPSGIARGNIFPMGNYDECLGIEEVDAKFCKVAVNLDLPFSNKFKGAEVPGLGSLDLTPKFYFCVLESCSAEDLNLMFHGVIGFDESQCHAKNSGPDLDALAIIAIVIFAIITLIALLSTIYDVYLYYSEKAASNELMIAFSVYTNGRKLFHLGKSQQLESLNGIKALSMLWVLLGHVYMSYGLTPLDNYLDIYNWLGTAKSQYFLGATVSVDTFLVVGGFLTIYTFQSSMDKGGNFNVPLYYFHRYLRLTPALAALVLAHVALFNYFGDGPVWDRTDTYLAQGCKNYWWSALLYVQNYANPNGICVPQSWYLSVDMQLYLISPLFLVLIRQWPFWGCVGTSLVSLVSIVGSFLVGWFYNLNGQLSGNISTYVDFMATYYMPTHTRMVPYLLGIMLGYAVYKMKVTGKKPVINPVFVILGWIVSLGLMAACIYGGHTLQFTEYNHLANSFYIALMRPTWAIAVCWVIFACVLGYGGPIDYFLSMSIFQILSRLSYSMYLVHYSFIFMTSFSTKSSVHFTEYGAFHKFWGDLAFTFAISVVWTLLFESPVIILEKVLFKRGRQSKNQKDPLV